MAMGQGGNWEKGKKGFKRGARGEEERKVRWAQNDCGMRERKMKNVGWL